MPQTRESDPQSPFPGPPLCPACGKGMRLTSAKASDHYVNLDDCTYACECGEQANFIMVRKE